MLTPPPVPGQPPHDGSDEPGDHNDQRDSSPSSHPLPVAVHAVLHLVEQRWDRLGLPPKLRAHLLSDLAGDLHAAYLDGITPEALLGTDATAFADEVAHQLGYASHPPAPPAAPAARGPHLPEVLRHLTQRGPAPGHLGPAAAAAGYGRVLLAAGLSGAVCLLVGLMVFMPLGLRLHDLGLGGAGPLLAYLAFACFFIGAVLAAVYRSLAGAGKAGETVRRAAVLLPASAVVSLPLAVYIGWVSGYSWRPAVLAAEVGLVLGGAALALVAARRWALGQASLPPQAPTPVMTP